MLPVAKPGAMRLADILPCLIAAMRGEQNRLGLRRVSQAVVVVADGLGADNLAASAGHARTLARAAGKPIQSGFPTTTAVALTSLTTGSLPGRHGIVGYDALVPGVGVRNQLREWGGAMDPATWQRMPTLFRDVPSFAINEPRFADSGFTQATLADATYVPGRSIEDRVDAALHLLDNEQDALIYLYAPEADRAGHDNGWKSGAWTAALEAIDAAVERLSSQAPPGAGILVTADHGMVDIAEHQHLIVDTALLDGIAAVAGEPRCLQLHVMPGADPKVIADAWNAQYGDVAWVVTKQDVVDAGWLGAMDAEVVPRIGDVIIAARAAVAFYLDDTDPARGMIGQHGSLSPTELRVPLLRFGSFA